MMKTSLFLLVPFFLVFVAAGCSGGDSEDVWSGKAMQIAVGGRSACALTDEGQIYCWGDGAVLQRGALAFGSANNCIAPFLPSLESLSACVNPFALRVVTDERFVEISASMDDKFCGRTAAGAVHCWPSSYPVCKGTADECSRSVAVSGDPVFASISGAPGGFFGITADGRAPRSSPGIQRRGSRRAT